MFVSLCRICLKSGAKLPLFEIIDDQNDLLSKLTTCLNEKIEDIDGFPRYICNNCKKALEEASQFIKKYKESCHILQKKLLVKEEQIQLNIGSCEGREYEDIEETNIKREESSDEEFFSNITKTNAIKNESNTKSNVNNGKFKVKIEKTKRIYAKNSTKGISKIASSILEGDFLWIGDTWCIKPINSKPALKKEKPIKKVEKSKCVQIQLPKVKKPKPPKLCDICGDIFKSVDRLAHHKKNVHLKQPMQCPQCPRVLSSDYNLRAHLKRRHQKEKEFICSICGVAFAFKGELANHNKTVHNKHLLPKKKFFCKICNKEYKCSRSVVVHERSVHTGYRPAVCSVCDSSFYHEDYLKEHMRLHTGETPFKCPICGRGYAQRGNMKSHLRNHRISELDANTLSKLRPTYLKRLKP